MRAKEKNFCCLWIVMQLDNIAYQEQTNIITVYIQMRLTDLESDNSNSDKLTTQERMEYYFEISVMQTSMWSHVMSSRKWDCWNV